MAVDVTKLELSPAPQITFIDPNTRQPAVGTIYFFEATDHTTPKIVYYDSGDPDNPYIATTEVELDNAGAFPYPIYLNPYDALGNPELYYLEGQRPDESVFFQVDNWPNNYPTGASGGGSTANDVYNFVTDGIFTFPFNWNIPTDVPGQITQDVTQIGQSWYYETSNAAVDKNNILVTFNELYEDNIAGNPVNACQVKVLSLSSTQSANDVYQTIGSVNLFQNEFITCFAAGKNNLSGTVIVNVALEFKYNSTAPIVKTEIGSFTFTQGAITSGSFIFEMPPLLTEIVDPNDNYLRVRYQFPLGVAMDAEITTLQIERGQVAAPKYIEVPSDLTKARTIANDWVEPQKTTDQKDLANYEGLYFKDGKYAFLGYAGQVFLPVWKASPPANIEIASGQVYKSTDYSKNNIPYKKVYDVWGTYFGGGTGIVATAAAAVVTCTSGIAGKPHLAWTADTNAHITVAAGNKGYDYGVTCTPKTGDPFTVVVTWNDKYTAETTPYVGTTTGTTDNIDTTDTTVDPLGAVTGFILPDVDNRNIGNYWNAYVVQNNASTIILPPQAPALFSISDTAVGSPTVAAVSEITFTQGASVDAYVPRLQKIKQLPNTNLNAQAYTGFFEFTSTELNKRARGVLNGGGYWKYPSQTPGVTVAFSVDSNKGTQFTGNQTVTIALRSTDGVQDIVRKFINTLNTPFSYKLTVTAVPAASSWVQMSTTTDDFYIWFKVDGTGTDPVKTGTAKEVDILSTDTLAEIATKIAAVVNDQEFNFPDQTYFPTGLDMGLEWGCVIA